MYLNVVTIVLGPLALCMLRLKTYTNSLLINLRVMIEGIRGTMDDFSIFDSSSPFYYLLIKF